MQEWINSENLKQLQASLSTRVTRKKLPHSTVELKTCYDRKNQGKVHKFKLYEEKDLRWPQESFLVINEKKIIPKNGPIGNHNRPRGKSNRIAMEQDYQSDRDIVNSAKNKLKRAFKQGIEEELSGLTAILKKEGGQHYN